MLAKFWLERFFLSACLAAAAMALASCATGPSIQPGGVVNVSMQGDLPPPQPQDVQQQGRLYYIAPFDKLRVSVYGIEDLSEREIEADAAGRISFPLVGPVDAAGLTPGELAEVIEARLRGNFIRNPQVTVNLEETVSQVVTVDGQVKKPGLYPVIGKMTLMRTLATAGGVSEFAKLDDVIVFRSVNGQQMAGVYNMKSIRSGTYADPEIYANDVVVVGDSPSRRILKDMLQLVPALATPIIVLLQQ